MVKLRKVEWACIGFMVIVVIIASVYLAMAYGWIHMWIVVVVVVLSFVAVEFASRRGN
jgi:hypothetical protein